MKVILLRDVAKIGKRFDITDVPDGYALNRLIPKGDAQPATPVNVSRINQQKSHTNKTQETQISSTLDFVKNTETSPLKIKREANEQGHLFQGVGPKDISKIAKDAGVYISEQSLKINSPIKELGEHEIPVVVQDKELKLNIKVIKK